jgi:hypothetical protein
MKRIESVVILLAALLVRTTLGSEDQPRVPFETLAEADLVVVAVAGPASVGELSNPPDDRRYLAVATLNISQVIKGTGAAPGVPLNVALSTRPTAVLAMVSDPEPPDPQQAIWFLRQVPANFPAPFGTVSVVKPGESQDFNAYVVLFQNSAATMQPFAAIHMELILPSTIVQGAPANGVVRLFTGPGESGTLPARFPWYEHVQIVLERDDDAYVIIPTPSALEPHLCVDTIQGVAGDTVPAAFPPGSSVQADVTVLTSGVNFEGTSAVYFAYARFVDDHAQTLVQAAPVVVTIAQP